jgi:nucleotide-binding universal stress UspA family protein
MIDIKRILCPIDFSDHSIHALDHAVAFAKWYGSSITLIHVRPPAPVAYPAGPGVVATLLTPQERAVLLDSMNQLQREHCVDASCTVEVIEGTAAMEILARAESMPADLVVMGTHGRSGFERLMLGSVTEKVLRKAACPVLTVPAAVATVSTPAELLKNIVCAVDFSDCSMHALTYALSIAEESDANLTVLHVIEVPPDLPAEDAGGPFDFREYVESSLQTRMARLNTAIPDDARAYCRVDTLVTTGKAYREILRVAEERKAGLLVVGIHGRGAIDRLLFGSTTQHLVRLASRPVLTLRKG